MNNETEVIATGWEALDCAREGYWLACHETEFMEAGVGIAFEDAYRIIREFGPSYVYAVRPPETDELPQGPAFWGVTEDEVIPF